MHLFTEEARVGEEQRRIHAVYDEAGQRFTARPVLDIPVTGRAADPPEHRVMRVRGAPHQICDRECRSHQNTGKDAQDEHTSECRHSEEALERTHSQDAHDAVEVEA